VNSVSPELLAEQYGTPLYVYRLDQAAAAWHALRRELPDRSLLHYSLKANPHPDLVARYLRLGARAEVSSSGELDTALAAGAPAHDCLYTGPAKSDAEVRHAIASGVRRFSVESELDFRRVEQAAAAAAAQVECLVRVNAQASGATSIRMSGAASQFGVELESLRDLRVRFQSTAHARVVGFHLFPVSNVHDEAGLLEVLTGSIRHARDAAEALGITPEFVDLGGGFAAPYAAPGSRPRYAGLRPALETALDEHLEGWRDGQPLIAFESGRHLAGECGQFVCTVMDVKTSGSRTFAVLDGGINHLGGMSGLGRLLRPSAEPALSGAPSGEVTLVGPLCTPADVLGLSIRLPPVEPGDVLVFPNTGAYGLTASLTAFLSRPAPVEVVVDRETVVSATRLQTFRSDIKSQVHGADHEGH
jgi:diaminopimelate decarboxylase